MQKRIRLILTHSYFWLMVSITTCLTIIYLSFMDTGGLPSVSIPHADKYVHFIEYFFFQGVWFMYLFTTFKKSFTHTSIIALIIVVFFGIIIEVLQRELTTHRSFDLGDILFNSLGAIASVVLFSLFANQLKQLRV